MTTTIFTPLMLRNGTRGVPEMPRGGGGGGSLATVSNAISMAFNGVDSSFSYDEYNLTRNNTISLWYYRSSGTTDVLVGQSANNAWYDYTIRLASDGGIKYAVEGVASVIDFNSGATKALAGALNVWISLIIVRTGDDAVCYVNGQDNDGVQTFSNGTNNIVTDRLGVAGDGTSFPFGGFMDEVAFFTASLDAPTVESIYSASLPLGSNVTADLSTLSTPPVAWYRMGD